MTLRTELAQELENILNYWSTYSLDNEFGGFLGQLDNFNRPLPNAPKGAILNARIMWSFSAAYRLTQRPQYLEMAQRAYDYFNQHFFDTQYGGIFWELDHLGHPLNTRKQIYAQAFALYGLSEFHRACGHAEALQQAIALYRIIEQHSFDPQRGGYFDAFSREWGQLADLRLSPKDENAAKTMNTHLHVLEAYATLYRVWPDAQLASSLVQLIHSFLHHIVQPTGHFGLFFTEEWTLSGPQISFGHDIEGSWLLHEAAELVADPALLTRVKEVALQMANSVAAEGLLSDRAVREELDPRNGHQDPHLHWWPQAEGVVGFVNAYQLSGEARFLQLANNIWDFTKQHIIDQQHGEWFWKVNPQGQPCHDDYKVGFWKCPYHNSRACLEIMERAEHLHAV